MKRPSPRFRAALHKQLRAKKPDTHPHIPVGSYGFRKTCYEAFSWTPWEVKRVLVEYPQEAQLLAIDFEETASHQAEQAIEQQKSNPRSAGRVHSNVGGDFEHEASIGDDDEIDWHDAEMNGAEEED